MWVPSPIAHLTADGASDVAVPSPLARPCYSGLAMRSVTGPVTLRPVTGVLSRRACGESGSADADALTHYVSPSGSDTSGDGSRSRPWATVPYALSVVGGGHTIIMLDGTYAAFQIPLIGSGTAERKTHIKAENRWKAFVSGGATHGVYTATGVHHVIVEGLNVRNNALDGIKFTGSYNEARYCYVYKNGNQGMSSHGYVGNTWRYCLVVSNGTTPDFDHGLYFSGADHLVEGCYFILNKSRGINTNGGVANTRFYNNVFIRNLEAAITIFEGATKNYFVNNTVCTKGVVVNNPRGCVVRNNIFNVDDGYTALSTSGTLYVPLDTSHNLVYGGNPWGYSSVGDVYADPLFYNKPLDVLWLQAASPARDAGTPTDAPSLDWWGRAQVNPRDIGAFVYSAYLLTGAEDALWCGGQLHETPSCAMPYDWWRVPQN